MTLFAELADRSWFPPDSFCCSVRKPEEGQALPRARTSGRIQAVGFRLCGQIFSNLSSKYGLSPDPGQLLKIFGCSLHRRLLGCDCLLTFCTVTASAWICFSRSCTPLCSLTSGFVLMT